MTLSYYDVKKKRERERGKVNGKSLHLNGRKVSTLEGCERMGWGVSEWPWPVIVFHSFFSLFFAVLRLPLMDEMNGINN
jgi:hypothetical protein